MPFLHLVVMNRDCDGLCGADEVDQPFAASDCGIEQISVKQFEVRSMDRDDHARALAPLIFMHRSGISENQFIEIGQVVLDLSVIESDQDDIFF